MFEWFWVDIKLYVQHVLGAGRVSRGYLSGRSVHSTKQWSQHDNATTILPHSPCHIRRWPCHAGCCHRHASPILPIVTSHPSFSPILPSVSEETMDVHPRQRPVTCSMSSTLTVGCLSCWALMFTLAINGRKCVFSTMQKTLNYHIVAKYLRCQQLIILVVTRSGDEVSACDR